MADVKPVTASTFAPLRGAKRWEFLERARTIRFATANELKWHLREDHVLDADLPVWIPLPTLSEVQVALQEAVAEVTQLEGYELKRIMRTGTIWTAAAVIAPGLVLGPLLAAGWRPSELPVFAAGLFWLGTVVAALKRLAAELAPGVETHAAVALAPEGAGGRDIDVVRLALQQVAPVVTLYVNDYNAPALAAYRRVGFTQVGTFASILF